MQASLSSPASTLSLRRRAAPAVATPRSDAESAEPTSTGLLESTQLLRGQKVVSILHNGALYRLQATKLGKLILTK